MKLERLMKSEELQQHNSNQTITDICLDSRLVKNGNLFFLLERNTQLQEKHLKQAINNGAAGIIAPKEFIFDSSVIDIPIIKVNSIRKTLSEVSSKFYPKQPSNILAITGTNGKTSVTKLTEEIWQLMGVKSSSIGTLGNSASKTSSILTTPDPISLHKQVNALASEGFHNLVIEASSHGLSQLRMDSLEIAGAALTSFSRDHLDYHSSMDSYFNAKKRLFTHLLHPKGTAVVNLIDLPLRYHNFINSIRAENLITIGNNNASISILDINRGDNNNIQLQLNCYGKKINVTTPFIAPFQAINSIIAGCMATINTDILIPEAFAVIEKLSDVRGRLECVAKLKDNNIYIDYAHTPDAMKSVLGAIRIITKNRLIIVFGAGGDRDTGKRSIMSDIADKYADLIIITDDNPRFEDPNLIRGQLMKQSRKYIEIANREEAISYGISELSSEDNLLICGKGHEEYIIYGKEKIVSSDHSIVEQTIKRAK
ncbi:MAG: UDP-N-acetylmuramoyl-L-alanyl-D-glutamate--2,6-diaminopimelate ligase [Rhizobiales bacterium]|nr:UDP-N-acetylmuramoyl-L-alanyl-D-glutamate--2,6-diaminopimelate ligase [Hyphomicrobiales bacterium]|tara:strand:- start:2421 stop:3872 length:1452 start_codon:yes stop_codon:yes gene_type:complete